MKHLFSIASWLDSGTQQSRMPDIGKRELDVLEALWRQGALTSHSTLQQLQSAGISLSTVQSTLERLNRKQLVSREKVGRAYVYAAAITKETIISRMMREIADSLAGGETAPMVSGFLDYLDASGNDAPDALRALKPPTPSRDSQS